MSIRRWIITTGLLGLSLTGLVSYKQLLAAQNQQQQEANAYEPVITVEATPAKMGSYQATVSVTGEVQAYKKLTISNELAGKIAYLNFASGSVVKKDQVLLVLDHSEQDAQLMGANARLELGQKRLKRLQTLHQHKKVSDEQLDAGQAEVTLAQAEIALLKTTIAKKTFTAPFTANVGIHTLEKGQYLDSNTAITTLVGLSDSIWIDFNLPQSYALLPLGSEVAVRQIGHEQRLNAKIIAVSPELSSSSRSLKYRVQLPVSVLALKPNTLVKLDVPTAPKQQVIKVPTLAVSRDQLGEYVFVLENEGKDAYRAKRTKVALGANQSQFVVVQSGLEVNQLVATKGSFKLWPEVKVALASAPGQPQGALK